jgi:Xaa-Pro aminopeptidase
MQPDLRSRAARHDALVRQRLDRLVPGLMRRAGVDAWVVAGREYNEDPVLQTMLPSTWLGTARRRTILLFLDRGDRVERLAVGRYAIGDDLFAPSWDPADQPDQWARLAELLAGADPKRIGVDLSAGFALADGISASEFEALMAALPAQLRARVTGAEAAAIGWLETRLPEEREAMAGACARAHGFLRRSLSREVITPGRTSTDDVEWWLRQVVHAAGHGTWFHPTVSLQRRGGATRDSFAGKPSPAVVEAGDLIHIDFGIVDDGYCTDQQQHGYVIGGDENEVPAGLAAGMHAANRSQDVLMAEFRTGRSGNGVLASARRRLAEEAIDALIYTHPIGLHGHAAGPTIGLWDRQDGVLGAGDYPLWPDTAYSIELQARVPVPEWDGQVVQFMLEEDAWFDGDTCSFLDDRQTEIWPI